MTYWSNAYVVEWNRKIFLRLRNKASCKRLKRLVEFFSNLLCEFLRLACWLDLCRTNSQKYQHKSCTNIFIWAQLNSFILRLIVECDFLVGFMSMKFFHHATKLDLRHAQAAQAPAERWWSCAITVRAELLDRFL